MKSAPCSLVAICLERTDLLAFMYVSVFCFICHFHIQCPGSGVVLDYIDSRSLPSFLNWFLMPYKSGD